MKSYPIVAILLEGKDVIATVRKMTGITKARDAEPGTIRGDFGMSQQYNLIHASENAEASKREEMLVFNRDEIFNWDKRDLENIYLEDELKG
jgi:nucleoside-diphosphate kinase